MLKPIPKNRQEQGRFTFDVSKCDRIFDKLLRSGNIKLSHAIPPLEKLKRRAYCKWHNSFSHATNNCNIFRRQIQSAINEGRLALHEMQVDKATFPVHTNDLSNAKVLIRPEHAEGAKGKNVIIGEKRPNNVNDKILAREVVLEKTPDGKESLKITLKASRPGGQESSS